MRPTAGRNDIVYPVFLSSVCSQLADLRRDIYHGPGEERYVYVDEVAHPRETSRLDPLARSSC